MSAHLEGDIKTHYDWSADVNNHKKITTMSKEINSRICPVELSGGLDNSIRKLLQNPRKILKPYITEGMTVLDLGCGPGFFTIEIANMLSDSGRSVRIPVRSKAPTQRAYSHSTGNPCSD